MRLHVPALDCTEPFTPCTRARERRVMLLPGNGRGLGRGGLDGEQNRRVYCRKAEEEQAGTGGLPSLGK